MRALIENIAILILVVVWLGISLWQAFDCRRAGVSRGYNSPPVLGGLVFLGFFGGLGGGAIGMFLASEVVGPPGAKTMSPVQFGVIIGSTVVAVFLVHRAARLLPQRSPRRAGYRRSRFPWRTAGVLCGAVVVLGVLVAIVTWNWNPLRLLVLAPVAPYCFYIARRARAPSLEEVLAQDSRPPVLYLRAFEREGAVFTELPCPHGLAAWGREVFGDRHRLPDGREVSTRIHTFESYFSAAVEESLGPLVALGNPTDYVAPEGAVRAYADDQVWTIEFARFARSATCVLVGAGLSDNLLWELRYLRETGLHQKLFLLTAPEWPRATALSSRRSILAQVQASRFLAGRGWQRTHADSWSDLPRRLAEVGYTVARQHIVPGAVINFDERGRSLLLASGLHAAAEYTEAIHLQLWPEQATSLA